MINSINVSTSSLASLQQTKQAQKVGNAQTTPKSEKSQASDVRRYDRLELSDDYKASKETDSAEETAVKEITAEAEEVDTDNLSQYTKSELRDFLFAGDISQSEYDEEMATRA